LAPRQIGAELFEHAPARHDGEELIGVTDQHHLRAARDRTRKQLLEIGGADHGRLVDHHECRAAELKAVVLNEVKCFGDGQPAVSGAFGHRLVDRLTGRRKHEHVLARPVGGRAQRLKRVRLARTRRRLQRLHQVRGYGDVVDGAPLIVREVVDVVAAQVEAGPVVGLVDHLKDLFLFGDDRLEGEPLVALTVMGLPRRADADADLVGDLLDQGPGVVGGVDG
jgi:hypothetical protein